MVLAVMLGLLVEPQEQIVLALVDLVVVARLVTLVMAVRGAHITAVLDRRVLAVAVAVEMPTRHQVVELEF
jgi:hypothetical protein